MHNSKATLIGLGLALSLAGCHVAEHAQSVFPDPLDGQMAPITVISQFIPAIVDVQERVIPELGDKAARQTLYDDLNDLILQLTQRHVHDCLTAIQKARADVDAYPQPYREADSADLEAISIVLDHAGNLTGFTPAPNRIGR